MRELTIGGKTIL